MSITLSSLARQDLDETRNYTIRTWGREQWLTYFAGLTSAFEGIMRNLEKGRSRELFCPGLGSANYQRHVIFYKRIAANGNLPVILRIVHQKQHLPALTYYEGMDG